MLFQGPVLNRSPQVVRAHAVQALCGPGRLGFLLRPLIIILVLSLETRCSIFCVVLLSLLFKYRAPFVYIFAGSLATLTVSKELIDFC